MPKNRSFAQKSEFCSKIEILLEILLKKFTQKYKLYSTIQILLKNPNIDETTSLFIKNVNPKLNGEKYIQVVFVVSEFRHRISVIRKSRYFAVICFPSIAGQKDLG